MNTLDFVQNLLKARLEDLVFFLTAGIGRDSTPRRLSTETAPTLFVILALGQLAHDQNRGFGFVPPEVVPTNGLSEEKCL